MTASCPVLPVNNENLRGAPDSAVPRPVRPVNDEDLCPDSGRTSGDPSKALVAREVRVPRVTGIGTTVSGDQVPWPGFEWMLGPLSIRSRPATEHSPFSGSFPPLEDSMNTRVSSFPTSASVAQWLVCCSGSLPVADFTNSPNVFGRAVLRIWEGRLPVSGPGPMHAWLGSTVDHSAGSFAGHPGFSAKTGVGFNLMLSGLRPT